MKYIGSDATVSSISANETYDQILSTFKFVDENQTDTTNWKTYLNTQYNYSLKHPMEWQEIIDPKSEGKEFTLKSPDGELIHGTVFAGTRDSSNDNNYRKTFDLAKNEYILITYVECDGSKCGFGKLDLATFDQILSTFKFLK